MTAQEFITAIKAGGTINVDSDIDFNDYYFSSAITIPPATVINGNGHTITNIQDGSTDYLFVYSGLVTINRLNIRNINILSRQLFRSTSANQSKFRINESQISGNCYVFHAGLSTDFNLNRCSIHINRFRHLSVNFNECYVIIENNLVTSGSSNIYIFGNIANNTYFKGKIKITNSMSLSTLFDNCCINFDIDNNNHVLTINNSPDKAISVINSTKVPNTSLGTNIIAVTDEEMHDAQSLFDKGFAIYVP